MFHCLYSVVLCSDGCVFQGMVIWCGAVLVGEWGCFSGHTRWCCTGVIVLVIIWCGAVLVIVCFSSHTV